MSFITPIGFFKKEVSKPKMVRVTFNSAPNNILIEKHPLRYAKDFAYSWSMDDSLQDAITIAHPLFAGGNAINDAGDRDLNLPGLYYTDGCGNDISFNGSLFLVGSWILTGTTSNYYICENDLLKMYSHGWGYVNHSYSHKDNIPPLSSDETTRDEEMLDEIINNFNIVKQYTSVRMNYFSSPSAYPLYNRVASGFTQNKVVLGTTDEEYFRGKSVELLLSTNDFSKRRTALSDFDINRDSSDLDRIYQYVSGATTNNHPWIHEFTHRMNLTEDSTQLSVNLRYLTAKDYFSRIASEFGKNGLDNIWFANFQDVYEYLQSYNYTSYSITQNSNIVDIVFDFSLIDSDFRNHSLSFNISGDTNISNIEYFNFDETSHNIDGQSSLVNVNYMPKYEKSSFNRIDAIIKVGDFETIKIESYKTVAQTAVDLLPNGSYKSSLQNRIDNVVVVPNSRTFQIDFGSNIPTRPSSPPWNNFSAGNGTTIPSGTTLSSLLDTTSQSSSLSIVATSENWIVEDSNTVTGTTYPVTATRDCFRVTYPNIGLLEIRNCDDNKKYTINILSARSFVGFLCDFTVQGTTLTVDPKNNSSTILTWENVSSTSGIIYVSAVVSTDHSPTTSYAYLNVLEIIETIE